MGKRKRGGIDITASFGRSRKRRRSGGLDLNASFGGGKGGGLDLNAGLGGKSKGGSIWELGKPKPKRR